MSLLSVQQLGVGGCSFDLVLSVTSENRILLGDIVVNSST